jgi:pimeloyl-ACP methyl ester carboxylesterase
VTAYCPEMARGGLVSTLAAAAVLTLCVVPGAALARAHGVSAPPHFSRCASLSGVLCAYVPVPLDRRGRAPGALRLFVAKRPAAGPARGTILLLAGGPGEASAQIFSLRSTLWQTVFPGYAVAAYDNRGTGDSGSLTCRGAATAAGCAKAIGPRRVFYGTRDNVEDTEAVRRALGVDRLALFGLSYGTKQALAYAEAYPDHVSRLLLDSVVLPNGPDPFGVASLQAIPAALESICHARACAAATGDVVGDFVTLVNRLEARPLVADVPVYTTHWTPTSRRIRIDGRGLLALATASDLNTGIAVTLPAAVKAALAGRPGLLERLAALVSQQDSSSVNDAVFYATTCTDGPFPWKPDTPVAERRSVLAKAVAELPAASLGRFGRWAAVASADQCLDWPAPAGVEPATAQPVPNVPVLVLAGDRDVRTPLAEGRAAAGLFPQGRLLVVPGVGHTVMGASSCVEDAVRTWIRGGLPPARCPRVASTIAPIAPVPRAVSAAKPLGRAGGRIGRTLGATVATLRQAEAAWLTSYPAGWVVGLEGGLLDGEDFDVFRYSAYSDVHGLAVSGRLAFRVTKRGVLAPGSELGIVQVGGASAANGFLQIRRHRIFGLLGGRHVSARF